MKKTFQIAHPKVKPARMFESIKHETKKYIKRERHKTLPEDAGFWDFDCKFGATEKDAEVIHVTEINKRIDAAEESGLTSFYVEILVKPGIKNEIPAEEQDVESVIPNKKWGASEVAQWFAQQEVKRSYLNDVVARLDGLKGSFEVVQYGQLTYAPEKYPLFMVKTGDWTESKKTILITGGVHGYETSGVNGAILFLEEKALAYNEKFNIIVVPCVSPWGYETINRWNPNAIDPNRSFIANSPAEESAELMKLVASLNVDIFAHIDLHETTDTDNSVFRPALAARDGVEQDNWNIPDGFYTVGDSDNPTEAFQAAIINSVKQVTHIAPPDENGRIIGELITQQGVINYPTTKLGLCTGFSNSQYCTTTEVYPDSPKVNDEECALAQVAAVTGGLDYLIALGH